ncbi:serine threonine- kinase SRK2A-like protein [Artemisia annua]|uniref:Serine threonine-kinase SRK2A-like protein n=1 Tax=Artemisia annua TaxID=35608 RepID=A0A2U1LIC3_ARTAN|nr:serine threonine- kinase SRK2A-like protein [Artemisia annua]
MSTRRTSSSRIVQWRAFKGGRIEAMKEIKNHPRFLKNLPRELMESTQTNYYQRDNPPPSSRSVGYFGISIWGRTLEVEITGGNKRQNVANDLVVVVLLGINKEDEDKAKEN